MRGLAGAKKFVHTSPPPKKKTKESAKYKSTKKRKERNFGVLGLRVCEGGYLCVHIYIYRCAY